jgi:hypothetical protein
MPADNGHPFALEERRGGLYEEGVVVDDKTAEHRTKLSRRGREAALQLSGNGLAPPTAT